MANEKVFDHRAENYAKARPGYAPEVHELFFKLFPAPGAAADIGCGTGIFAKPLLERGLRVFGVEPNGEMREKAVKALSGFSGLYPRRRSGGSNDPARQQRKRRDHGVCPSLVRSGCLWKGMPADPDPRRAFLRCDQRQRLRGSFHKSAARPL